MSFDRRMANALRFLAVDAVEAAKSGHPGMPLGMADIAQKLWVNFLKHNPKNPNWQNRDRFVLSNGHGSMLLYGLLHLSGYEVTIQDLKDFRKLGSITPGHPELGITPGVEATTGPLGQGIANAVGMAIAEKTLAATYNRDELNIIDHYTYAFVGDGCLMEGVSHEACSLAGTLALGKLIIFWDDNGISIDGEVKDWFSEDVALRFKAYGFHVVADVDGHDAEAIAKAITEAKQEKNKPTLIICKTQIAFGSPTYVNTAAAHGAPLGAEEIAKMRESMEWHYEPFEVPKDIKEAWNAISKGEDLEDKWQETYRLYKEKYPELAISFAKRFTSNDVDDIAPLVYERAAFIQSENKKEATRQASHGCIEFLQEHINSIFGGSADLSCSNLTEVKATKAVKDGWDNANYIHYGVREFAMFAIANGLSSYGGFIPFCGTFLTFVDYGKNALRLAAMAKQRVIYVLTHDSIGLGEDGPTHQPVEHNSMLRAMPGVRVWRPADSVETNIAWYEGVRYSTGPTCLLLSRQKLPMQQRTKAQLYDISKGGYVLAEFGVNPKVVLIATGSEVSLAITAAQMLESQGISSKVVSMPCLEVFMAQDSDYKRSVLPPEIKTRIAIEAGSSQCWFRIVGSNGFVYGLDRYGESGEGSEVMHSCGFTAEKISKAVKKFYEERGDYYALEGENYVN